MRQALYRKYRAKSLDEIVGQKHVTEVLRRSIKLGRVSHAYLLTGPRGIGKTSIARILAHEITDLTYSGEEHLDIIEIDAASNNGVEDIRDLRDKVQVAPVVSAKKVYIIDEVHMLSKPAFNALLKTLEEPPEHIVFILATTDPEKLPATVISRTQRFNLRRIDQLQSVQHLQMIADKESINIEPEALSLLAEHGDGSFRDSINLLDQLSAARDQGPITAEDVRNHLGVAAEQLIELAIAAYQQADLKKAVKVIDQLEAQGVSAVIFSRQLLKKGTEQLISSPELLPLLDSLTLVESSRRPDISLLVALAKNLRSTPSTNGSVEPNPNSLVEVPSSAGQAKSLPKEPDASQAKAASLESKPKQLKPKATPKVKEVVEENEPQPDSKRAVAAKPSDSTDSKVEDSLAYKQESKDYPWQDLIEAVRQESIGLSDLLKKSGYHYDGHALTVYCGNRLYKNKLDTVKYRTLFTTKSNELGATVAELEITADKPPIADPGLASVADLMGGGEVVAL